MAVKTKEEIIDSIKSKIGDNTDDETLSFLEDVSDTLEDLETKSKGDGTDWKKKYEENDKEWRTKYRDRFFGKSEKEEQEEEHEEDKDEPKTFADLFK